MLIVPNFEKLCSTCAHWRGKTSIDEAGFVYALRNLGAPCAALACWVEEEPDRALTGSADTCDLWQQRGVAAAAATDVAAAPDDPVLARMVLDSSASLARRGADPPTASGLDGEAGRRGGWPPCVTPLADDDIVIGQPLPWPVFDEEANLLLRTGDIIGSRQELDALTAGGLVYRPNE